MYRRLCKSLANLNSVSGEAVFFSTKAKRELVFLKKYLPAELDSLCEQFEDKILHSSFLENNKVKLGYQKNKALQQYIIGREQAEKLRASQVKEFPVSLKYLLQTKDSGLEETLSTVLKPQPTVEEDSTFISVRSAKTTTESKSNSATLNTKEWMRDYDIFDEAEDNADCGVYGTPDPTLPISSIPCGGCGAHLHCAEPSLPGYLPSEIYRGRTKAELKTAICQRCHFLKHYDTAINVSVPPEEYVRMISSIEDKFALIVLMVDLIDMPCSIWPGLTDLLGNRRPIFVVGNKVDILPKDTMGHLNHVKECLMSSVIEAGIPEMNIKHVCLISAATGFGVEEMITNLYKIWGYKGDVYLVGCTNVGKSSLFNALLRSDFCKVQAKNLIQKATASPWPGTTLRMLKFPILRPSDKRLYERTLRIISERSKKAAEMKLRKDQAKLTGRIEHATLIGHIGETFTKEKNELADPFTVGHPGKGLALRIDEKSKDYVDSRWCFDTPGVVQKSQIINLLTTEELLKVLPKIMIRPRAFLMKPGMSLFLAGLGRVDYIHGLDSIRVIVYAAPLLEILICKTENADEIYEKFLGSEVFGVPIGGNERLANWPTLQSSNEITITGADKYVTAADILLSSAGWIGINLPKDKSGTFRAWTPEQRGIVVRQPALIPFGVNLRGARVRGSLAYRVGKAFIKQ